MNRGYAMAIAILPAFCILVGLVIGTLRYVKYGKEIRKRVEEDYREKRAAGGIKELYYKRPDKRVAYNILPILGRYHYWCIKTGWGACFLMLELIIILFEGG